MNLHICCFVFPTHGLASAEYQFITFMLYLDDICILLVCINEMLDIIELVFQVAEGI